ncbi:HAD family hydrolase [Ornithinimicrobium panacihumi]|uniref:HAD family hydrolase n=1 Tax=Ornithinimicrobium panacihumi TaxID=2008449 RepID=UPI003F88C946
MTDSPDPSARLVGVPAGSRVVVRHLIEGGARATDVLGELVSMDHSAVTLTSHGRRVVVPRSAIVAAKPIIPRGGGGRGGRAGTWRVAAFLRRARVAVLDLDGVVRRFNETAWQDLHERSLGLPAEGLLDLAFSLPEATAMVVGKATYEEWLTAFRRHLGGLGHDELLVEALMRDWALDRGTPITATTDVMDELVARGTPVFVFTNGTDRVPEELESIGLGRFVPHVLNSHVLGWAKPAPEAYAVAHAEIQRRLGRTVGTAEVHFTDDRPGNVEAARVFGWQARVFTAPA